MLYKVSELSKLLGVTRTTVYNKVKTLNQEIKPYTRHKKGVLMIDDEGLELIRKSLELSSTLQNDIQDEFTVQPKNIDNINNEEDIQSLNFKVDNELVSHLKDEIAYLRKENENKSNLVAMQ